MTTTENFNQLVETFLKLNNELTQIQKRPIAITPDSHLSTSALHLLATIGIYPKSTITQLASKLGVTKGNVSQQIPKLVAMKLITVTQSTTNKKNKLISLTPTGAAVQAAHQNLHAELYQTIQTDLAQFSPDQIQLLLTIMRQIMNSISQYQHSLTKGASEHA